MGADYILEEELSGFANRLMEDMRELEVAYRPGRQLCCLVIEEVCRNQNGCGEERN